MEFMQKIRKRFGLDVMEIETLDRKRVLLI